jgi:5-methyltetrahydrofolate--homocysteine methyltransferase
VDSLSVIHEAILAGDAAAAEAAVRQALAAGAEPQGVVTGAISPALDRVGQLFESGDYFLPDLLVSARATKGVFDVLRPLLARGGVATVGRVAMGTVRGDVHDIGKNLVAAMLEGAGFEVVDLGVDVPAEAFVRAAAESGANVVGLSALLTTSLPSMKASIDAMTAAGVRAGVKVIVGGAPVTAEFAKSIGADGYASSAATAVDMVMELVGAGRAANAGKARA